MRSAITAVVLVTAAAGAAQANIRITEYMYTGLGGEFVEFTNTGPAAVDLTGWSYSDNARLPGSVDLSAFGLVAPGESVILTEATATNFRFFWSLPAALKVIGSNSTQNIGRNDEINIYDAASNLIDRLTYNDQGIPGSIRAQNISGNPLTPADLGANNILRWTLSGVGDIYGSYASTAGDIGNPGIFIPAPAATALLGLAGLMAGRRRR